jgi:hypothetical protein
MIIGQSKAASAGGAGSTWNPADAATYHTISNGNLTIVRNSTAGGGYRTVRDTTSQTSGKFYIEFLCSLGTNAVPRLGFCGGSFNLNTSLGSSAYSGGVDDWGTYASTGFTSIYGSGLGGQNFSTGSIAILAVDLAGYIWFGKNNVWANSGNPSAGTGYILTFNPATTGPIFVGLSTYDVNGVQGTWTIKPTSASQTYSRPSGFAAWG